MSHHISGLGLHPLSMDARSHLTDLYVFQKPADPDKTILIANVNPLSPMSEDAVDDESAYEFLIDTNGDALADLAFWVRFSPIHDGRQCATVWLAKGPEQVESPFSGKMIIPAGAVSLGAKPEVTTSGGFRFFAGLRSDPFFADVEGATNNFQWTGRDTFADKNVFAIVLEAPNSSLGPRPQIGVWARVLVPHDGRLMQGDRVGRPAIDAVFNQTDDDKRTWNLMGPERDRELFAEKFAQILSQVGGYPADRSKILAESLLPDILTYDHLNFGGYPNGRGLADDVINMGVAVLSNGAVPRDGLLPHKDLLAGFPYLGEPHQ